MASKPIYSNIDLDGDDDTIIEDNEPIQTEGGDLGDAVDTDVETEAEPPDETPEPAEADKSDEPIEAEGEQPEPAKPDEDDERKTRAERRIAQLTAARKAAEEQLATEREDYQRQLETERKAREEAAAKLAEYEKRNADTQLESMKAKRLSLRKEIEEARGELDYDKAAVLQDELDDLNQEMFQVRNRAESSPQEAPQQPATPSPQPQPAAPQPAIPEEQKIWLRTNDWFASPKDLKQRRAQAKANELYDEMLKLGYDPNDPQTYEDLDAELKEAGFDFQRKPMKTAMVDKSGVSSGSAAPPARNGKSQRAKLTQADLRFMELAGLNPHSQTDRRAYLNADKGLI